MGGVGSRTGKMNGLICRFKAFSLNTRGFQTSFKLFNPGSDQDSALESRWSKVMEGLGF